MHCVCVCISKLIAMACMFSSPVGEYRVRLAQLVVYEVHHCGQVPLVTILKHK